MKQVTIEVRSVIQDWLPEIGKVSIAYKTKLKGANVLVCSNNGRNGKL